MIALHFIALIAGLAGVAKGASRVYAIDYDWRDKIFTALFGAITMSAASGIYAYFN